MELVAVILVALLTTSSSMVGAAIVLHATVAKRVIVYIVASAAGSLKSNSPAKERWNFVTKGLVLTRRRRSLPVDPQSK